MTGFFRCLKLIIRRERIVSSLWIAITVLFTALIAAIYTSFMGDEMSRVAMIEILKSPPVVGMIGPPFESENYTVAMAFAHIMTCWALIATGVMNIFFVNRHTRVDEEQGRLEMLRSLPVSKFTNGGVTLFAAFLLNVVIAIFLTLALLVVNFEGCTFVGAVAYSFELASFGMVMAAITLLFAQLFSTSRGVSSGAFVALGVFYLMRLVGDYSDSVLSYISPLGLGLRTYAFFKNNFYPMIVQFGQMILISSVAFYICSIRDLGEGVIPAKKGRANAKKSLLSPFGFVVRLTKNTVIGWCVAIFVTALMCGAMLGDIEGFVEANEFFKQMLNYDENATNTLVESSIALFFLILAHISVIPVIMISQKLRVEEANGRLEQVFGRAVKRNQLLVPFIAVALIQSVLIQFCSALAMFAAGQSYLEASFGQFLSQAFVYLPSMWFLCAVAVLLTGIYPKGGVIAWLLFAYSFLMVYMGSMLNVPEILQTLTPFGCVPQIPIEGFNPLPLAILTASALIFTTIGCLKFSKRDSY